MITKSYYIKEHKGKINENLEILIQRAEQIINNMTFGRINQIGFQNLTEFQKKSIKKAIAHTVDYIAENDPEGEKLASYWAGDIRINLDKNKAQKPWEAYNCGIWAYLNILQTGLARNIN